MNEYTFLLRTLRPIRRRDKDAGWSGPGNPTTHTSRRGGHRHGASAGATAVCHQAPVVTSDPGGLTRIAAAIGVKLRLFPV
jgi:hypothetical protein